MTLNKEEIAEVELTSAQPDDFVSEEQLRGLGSRKELIALLKKEKNAKYSKARRSVNYENELVQLQIELVKMQTWITDNNKRLAIIIEGRDAAGKGGSIRRFTEHLNPRHLRVVALSKPSEVEKGQWYFRRYIKELPDPGEIVVFDRSWYNRAVVEPVMGFCTQKEYKKFMQQIPEFEHMLYEDGVDLIKFWFSISKEEQQKRFKSRETNLLKQWKLSPVDAKSQELWDRYTHYKEDMFSRTHTSFSPWIVVKANDKLSARINCIRYVLSAIDYKSKGSDGLNLYPDPDIVTRFHRSLYRID